MEYSPIFVTKIGLAKGPDEFPVLLLQLLQIDLVRVLLLLPIVAEVVGEEYTNIVESVHGISRWANSFRTKEHKIEQIELLNKRISDILANYNSSHTRFANPTPILQMRACSPPGSRIV